MKGKRSKLTITQTLVAQLRLLNPDGDFKQYPQMPLKLSDLRSRTIEDNIIYAQGAVDFLNDTNDYSSANFDKGLRLTLKGADLAATAEATLAAATAQAKAAAADTISEAEAAAADTIAEAKVAAADAIAEAEAAAADTMAKATGISNRGFREMHNTVVDSDYD